MQLQGAHGVQALVPPFICSAPATSAAANADGPRRAHRQDARLVICAMRQAMRAAPRWQQASSRFNAMCQVQCGGVAGAFQRAHHAATDADVQQALMPAGPQLLTNCTAQWQCHPVAGSERKAAPRRRRCPAGICACWLATTEMVCNAQCQCRQCPAAGFREESRTTAP